jgi:hypothetical protein
MSETPRPDSSRRRLFAGAGAVGAAAALVAVLPRQPEPTAVSTAPPTPDGPGQGGYRLTEHVKRYYETARV